MADGVNPDEDIVGYVEKCVNDFEAGLSDWSAEAWAAYDFLAGRQYAPEDEEVLKRQQRPPIVFNLIGKFIDAVAGSEINNRMIPRYYPSAVGKSGPVDVVTELTQALLDDSAEEEHSDSFQDALVAGYGWLESSLTEEDGCYRIKESRVDPFEMGWDPVAKKSNLADSRYRYHRKYMDPDEVEAQWPGKADELKLSYEEGSRQGKYVQISGDSRDYRGVGVRDFRGQVAVIRFQYKKLRNHVVFKSMNGPEQTVDARQFSKLKKELEGMGTVIEKVREFAKVCYYQAWYCRGIVLEGPDEIPGWTYHVCTGKRDLTRGYFYGLLRPTKDPQLWTNKFFSNIMHVMSSSGKGAIVERSAVSPKDQLTFEADYARPDKIKYVADGALERGRIKPMDPTPLPQGLPDLLQFATQSINNTIGINLEFLGMNYRTQSGPVEQSRKQSGLAVLSKFFQSRRAQLKEIGRCRLDFMQTYVPQEQLYAVLDDMNKPYFPQTQDELFKKYYVKVDEVPTSGDTKEDVWRITVELIPYLMNVKVPPQFMVELLAYSPFPSALIDNLRKTLAQPSPEAEIALEGEKAKVVETKSKAMLNIAKANSEGASPDQGAMIESMGELMNKQMEAKNIQLKGQMDMAKIQTEMQRDEAKHGHMMAQTAIKQVADRERARTMKEANNGKPGNSNDGSSSTGSGSGG